MVVRVKFTHRPVAYSYIRFSSKRQATGDSLRRQAAAVKDWCDRNKVRLDTSITLQDLGKSAYTGEHRKNPDRNALALFLKLVEDGRIPAGSYLIVESLDRLSREDIDAALELLLGLIRQGIKVVQLQPTEVVYEKPVDPMKLIIGVVELSRANSESKLKSERCGKAWREKKKAAREKRMQPPRRKDGRVCVNMSANCPRWLEERGGKLVPIKKRVEVVQRIFGLAASGYGLVSIAKKLTADGTPSFGGRRATWTRSYLALILADRRVLGEHQPRKIKDGKMVPDGPAIKGYYPGVVKPAEFQAAASGRKQRAKRGGAIGQHVNVFQGLLQSAADGGPYMISCWRTRKGRTRALIPYRAVEGLARYTSFNYDTLEAAVLACLKEVDPADVLPAGDGPNLVRVLSGDVRACERELAAAVAFMDAHGFSPAIGKKVTALEARKAELEAALADAQADAANPAEDAWGELQSLADVVAEAADPDDVRLRVRAALRRVVTDARMLVAVRGRDRVAAVQLWFGEDSFRVYHVLHRPPANGQDQSPTRWWATAFKYPDADDGDADGLPVLDLRRLDDTQRHRDVLLTYDPPGRPDDYPEGSTICGELP